MKHEEDLKGSRSEKLHLQHTKTQKEKKTLTPKKGTDTSIIATKKGSITSASSYLHYVKIYRPVYNIYPQHRKC